MVAICKKVSFLRSLFFSLWLRIPHIARESVRPDVFKDQILARKTAATAFYDWNHETGALSARYAIAAGLRIA
jgi:hypothetical protein